MFKEEERRVEKAAESSRTLFCVYSLLPSQHQRRDQKKERTLFVRLAPAIKKIAAARLQAAPRDGVQ
jgi:hypothetical protein